MADSLPTGEPASEDRVVGEPAPNGRKPKTIGGGVLLALLLSSTLFAGAAGLFYFWSAKQLNVAEQQHSVAVEAMDAKVAADKRAAAIEKKRKADEAAAAAAAAREEAEKAARDKSYTDAGWSVTMADGIYYAPLEGDYYCTDAPMCAIFSIVTDQPCMAGVFVSVSMLRGDVSYEGVSGVSAGLPAGSQAQMELGASSDGDTYRITDIHCLG
jgi:hypothetical protein